MNGSNMRKMQTSSTDQSCTLIMQCLFKKINQYCLSLESYQDTQIAKYVLLKCIKETRFTIILFYFLSAMTCLSLTLQKKP